MAANDAKVIAADFSEIETLKARLQEAEDTLEAIRNGQVDAVVVASAQGERVFSLAGAEHSYRVMIEAMHEGAIIANREWIIQYCNQSFAEMVRLPLESMIGQSLRSFVDAPLLPVME